MADPAFEIPMRFRGSIFVWELVRITVGDAVEDPEEVLVLCAREISEACSARDGVDVQTVREVES